jgi:hypothetical protein
VSPSIHGSWYRHLAVAGRKPGRTPLAHTSELDAPAGQQLQESTDPLDTQAEIRRSASEATQRLVEARLAMEVAAL